MVYVSPVIELLRARPALVFWVAAIAQALLWILVPAVFYASPPGDVPLVLAIGHEWQLGTWLGPPLAYWLAELAFRAAGNGVAGVYALSQACVVVTLWAVFALGRAIVGAKHGAIAVLLMTGIAVFSVPTPDFGPGMLAMPLTALALLFYWRSVAERRRSYWFALGIALGLLLLTTYSGVIMIGLIAAFTAVTRRGRAALRTPSPWLAIIVAAVIALPHALWLHDVGMPALSTFSAATIVSAVVVQWPLLVAGVLLAHAGLMVLAAVAGALFARKTEVPLIEREPVGRFGRAFVYVFALVPVLAATLAMALGLESALATGFAPFVVLSGLAVVLAAGNVIGIARQSLVGWIWLALLVGPALLTAVAMVILPSVFGIDVKIRDPGPAMAQFFTDSFNRRTGRPLAIVAGDARLGGLVALDSPDRPRLFIDATSERAPWIGESEIAEKGAIVVWPITDATGQPPAAIRTRFPDLMPEVPQAFERAIQGRLLRVGWAVIRPASTPAPQ